MGVREENKDISAAEQFATVGEWSGVGWGGGFNEIQITCKL